ncbi:MAG: DUF58 domain-containing protein [Thermoplasmata archaeon]
MNELKISKKAYIYIVIFFVFMSFGVMLRIPQLIFITIPLIVYIFLGALSFKFDDIEIKREVENKIIFEGESFKMKFIIKSVNTEGYLEIINNDIREEIFLKNNETRTVEKNLVFKNFGRFNYSEIKMILHDRYGIFIAKNYMRDDFFIRVYPVPENLRKFSIKPKRTRSVIGEIPSKYIGTGSEFHSIREFQEGDDIRRINWKKTAMLDDLMINEFLAEKSGNAVILLDARKYQKSQEEYKKMIEGQVKATLTLSTAITRTRNRLGLIILKDTVDWVYPGYGRTQLIKINERLLNVESKSEFYVPVEYGKRIITRFFPPNSFIIIIGTLFDKNLIDIAVELVAKKYELLVVVPYLIETSKDTVSRILNAERKVRMRIISKYATVVEWDITMPLTRSLEAMAK